jgi:hypothetical protein
MFVLDLFNNDHERRLAEGAVDQLEQRRIDDLAMKMDDLVARARTASTAEAKQALMKEFQKCKAERDGYYKVRNETMGYGSMVGEGQMKQEMHKSAERMSLAQFINRYGDEEWIREFWNNINGPMDEAGIPGNVPVEKIPGKEDLLKGQGRKYYESDASRAVDNQGRTQQEWMNLVKSKFPGSRILQAKMIDGPVVAYLPDGKKIGWKKAEKKIDEITNDQLNVLQGEQERRMLGSIFGADPDELAHQNAIRQQDREYAQGAGTEKRLELKRKADEIAEIKREKLRNERVEDEENAFRRYEIQAQRRAEMEKIRRAYEHELKVIDNEHKNNMEVVRTGNDHEITKLNMEYAQANREREEQRAEREATRRQQQQAPEQPDKPRQTRARPANPRSERARPARNNDDDVVDVDARPVRNMGRAQEVRPTLSGPGAPRLTKESQKKNSETVAEEKASWDYDLSNNPWHVTDVDAVTETDFEVALQGPDNQQLNFIIRPIDFMETQTQRFQIDSMDVRDLQSGKTMHWSSGENMGQWIYIFDAIDEYFWQSKPLQQHLKKIIDYYMDAGEQGKNPDLMPGLSKRPIQTGIPADRFVKAHQDMKKVTGQKELDEGKMGEIDAQRQDLERMNDRQFYTAYGLSKAAFQQKYRTLLKPALEEGQQLHAGDPVVVTGSNEFEGKTGEIHELSPSGKFVIVDLYNHGKHSMHLSDVEYNQYADQEETDDWYDEDLNEFAPGAERDDDVPNQLLKLANRWWNATDDQPRITNILRSLGWSIAQVESEDDAVQLMHDDGTTYFISADDFDPDVFEGWSDAMVARRTGGARTPYSVYIKGKKWKDFENDDLARAVMNKLKAKFRADGRDPETITIAPTDIPEGVAEGEFTIANDPVAHTKILFLKTINGNEYRLVKQGDVYKIYVNRSRKTKQEFPSFDLAKKALQQLLLNAVHTDQEVAEVATDYSKRRQRERDVDAGRPVTKPRQPKMTDYQKRRAQQKKDMELGENQLNELASGYASNKGYNELGTYKRYNTFVSKKKFNNLAFIAVAENPRTNDVKFKATGTTPEEAVAKLHAEIDKEIVKAPKVSGAATIDFNVDFVRDILEMSTNPFYAKIVEGPRLVIAGKEMEQYPEIMQGEGFKRSSIRTVSDSENATKLPAMPLSARANVVAGLIANGRYVLSSEQIDKDGNRIFGLEFDSVVEDPRERIRMGTPAITIATKREVAEDQDTSGVERAILHRIMTAHTDLLKQFGPEKVMQAAEEVAYNVGDVDEIGTSDVSAYVHQVKQILGVPEKVNEKWSQKYKSSINCANPKGFSQKAHCAGKKK